jgi:hypothetical protein
MRILLDKWACLSYIEGRGDNKMTEKRFTYKVTKMDKARAIVCALYHMDHLPAEDHWHVKKISRWKMEYLDDMWAKARVVINEMISPARP